MLQATVGRADRELKHVLAVDMVNEPRGRNDLPRISVSQKTQDPRVRRPSVRCEHGQSLVTVDKGEEIAGGTKTFIERVRKRMAMNVMHGSRKVENGHAITVFGVEFGALRLSNSFSVKVKLGDVIG
jgi:hypothetical protein